MSAGSLTLGGNLSIAVGPLGRNAEGSGTVSSKGKVAAMYSYSKTKGLFGGVSVEGSVIVERQDANRIAYGGNPTVKQILSGQFDAPDWANVLVEELDRCTGSRLEKRWKTFEEEGADSPWGRDSPVSNGRGGRDRSGSGASATYAFGQGVGAGGKSPVSVQTGRRRAGTLFSQSGDKDREKEPNSRASPRPDVAKRASSFNPFSSGGSTTPKQAGVLPSSESYNAGLTWDSSGPMSYGNRSRSGSNTTKNGQYPGESPLAQANNLLRDWDEDGKKDFKGDWGRGGNTGGDSGAVGEKDLLGRWDTDNGGLSKSFARMSTTHSNGDNNGFRGTPHSGRSRSGSKTMRFGEIPEDEYVPYETESAIATAKANARAPSKMSRPPITSTFDDEWSTHHRRKPRPFSSYIPPSSSSISPFGEDAHERRPFDDYITDRPSSPLGRRTSTGPKPTLSLRAGLESTSDGYARAVALYEFAATDSGDLGLKKGQVVAVVDKVGNGDWWKGRATNGRMGIFPSNYVEVLEIPQMGLKGGVSKGELKSRMASLPFD